MQTEDEFSPRGPETYAKRETAPVALSDLQALCGEYESEELGVTYHLSPEEDTVQVRIGSAATAHVLQAINRDLLTSDEGLVFDVLRSEGGSIIGLAVSAGRVRSLRLSRSSKALA
ncbi:MAG: hypothetical protein U0670_09610 [Anaerolineae bacterium]